MTNNRPCSLGKTIFLTGAAGVVGQALLEKLSGHTVICLVHRTPISGNNVISLPGDISSPWLGLSYAQFNDLAQRIDCVVHAATITNLSRPEAVIFRVNVEGTQHVLDLAATAGVPFYHISTAFVHPCRRAMGSDTPNAYDRSKLEAERVVRESGLLATIVRPSIVAGDSQTGAIVNFQGLHLT
jgi:thioester reductase-like protein